MSLKTYLYVTAFLLTCIISAQSKAETDISEASLQAKRERLTPGELSDHLSSMADLKALGLKEIKKTQKELYLGFDDSFARNRQYEKERYDRLIQELKKAYRLEEHKYGVNFEWSSSEDSTYLKFLESGLKFKQTFLRDTTYLQIKTKIYGTVPLSNGWSRTKTDPQLNFYSFQDVVVKKIFYADGTVALNPKNEPYCPSPNWTCPLGIAKSIDSVQTHFSIDYITKIDSVTFTKADIGKAIDSFRVLEFDENMIIFEDTRDKIMKINGYDSTGEALDSGYQLTTVSCGKTDQEEYDFNYKLRKTAYEGTRRTNDLDNALKAIENSILDYTLNCTEHHKIFAFYEGNIEKVTVYVERERDSMKTDATFFNIKTDYEYHINPFDTKTDFINGRGDVLFSVPIGDLNFVYDNNQERNRHYVYDYDGNKTVYYYINVQNKELKKLEDVTTVSRLTENLVSVYKYGEAAIFDRHGANVNGFVYDNVSNGESPEIAQRKDRTVTLINSKGEEVGPKNITSFGTFRNGMAKAVQGEKVGFIALDGTVLVPFIYELGFYSKLGSESLTESQIVRKDNLYGIVDLKNNGTITVPVTYYHISALDDMKEPLYLVKKTFEAPFYHVINTQGKIIIPPKHTVEELEEMLNSGTY